MIYIYILFKVVLSLTLLNYLRLSLSPKMYFFKKKKFNFYPKIWVPFSSKRPRRWPKWPRPRATLSVPFTFERLPLPCINWIRRLCSLHASRGRSLSCALFERSHLQIFQCSVISPRRNSNIELLSDWFYFILSLTLILWICINYYWVFRFSKVEKIRLGITFLVFLLGCLGYVW